jgi:hypothetical protein
MCEKCHDLTNVVSTASSFPGHVRHVSTDGFSCSTCHTAHGIGSSSGSISGQRLVNFDANIVAGNGTDPITYSQTSQSCTLVCHNHNHASSGYSRAKPPGQPTHPRVK